jgi:hypothetical protein
MVYKQMSAYFYMWQLQAFLWKIYPICLYFLIIYKSVHASLQLAKMYHTFLFKKLESYSRVRINYASIYHTMQVLYWYWYHSKKIVV